MNVLVQKPPRKLGGRFTFHGYKFAVAILATAGIGRGCDCSKAPEGLKRAPDFVCEDVGRRPGSEDTVCSGEKRFADGRCVEARCDAGGVGCCPGTVCGAGLCRVPPRFQNECQSDDDCQVAGQRCLDRPRVTDEHATCGFPGQSSEGTCPSGSFPFNQRCVGATPCDGGCGPGQVCNIDTNNCEAAPDYAASCQQTCGEAELLVYDDPDMMLFDQCCKVECRCATVPPLEPGRWGRYSDLVVGDQGIYVSAYDTTYGDLVLATHARLNGDLEVLEYVDGVPATGPIVGNPEGPRGGRDAPGPDVGTHTAIALQGEEPRITYYDRDERQLKYAAYDAGSDSWTLTVIDDGRLGPSGTADVGRYSSLRIDENGIPHVTYFADRIVWEAVLVTTPMYARAKTTNPVGYDDWEHLPVDPLRGCGGCNPDEICVLNINTPTCVSPAEGCADCACDESCVNLGGSTCRRTLADRLEEPCNGFCVDGTSCVDDNAGGTECLPPTPGACGGACGQHDLCVAADGGSVCRSATPYSVLQGLPEGNGLFTSMVLDGDNVTVAFYDRLRRHLRGAIANFGVTHSLAAGFTAVPLACDPFTDVGQHPSLALAPAGLGIAFQGEDGKTLWYWEGADFLDLGATLSLVDDGDRGAGTIHLVGAYASLAFDGLGRPFVAYADQTANDLLLAWQDGGDWHRHTVLEDGAYGSFARLVIHGNLAYLSNYLRAQGSGGRDLSRLVVRLLELDSLP